MKTSTIVWIVIVIIIILGLGWYFLANNSAMMMSQTATTTATTVNVSTAPATTTTSSTAAAPVVMASTNASLGTILVAPNGMTLYTYSPDTANKSNCTGQCAVNWPPYTVSAGSLTAASGISGTLATTIRDDGSTQLTYNGHPLYYYVKDSKPGDTNGQGVGGIWYVVNP